MNYLKIERCRLRRSDVRDRNSIERFELHNKVFDFDLRLIHNCEKNEMRLNSKQRSSQTQIMQYNLFMKHRDCIRANDELKKSKHKIK